MNLRKHKGPILHDPEIEKSARSNRKLAKVRKAAERPEIMAENMITPQELERRLAAERDRWLAEQADEALRKEALEREKSCLDSITPQFRQRRGVIYGDIGANQTFKIDASILSSLRDIQFNGLKDECPIDHLRNFLDVASCYQVAHVSTDQLHLRLFP